MLLSTAAASSGTGALLSLVIPLAIIFLLMYFMIMRPQKKEQQRVKSMLAAMEVGDTVVTTSGFYGVLINITEEDVIVEFGNNRNCRIPMRKSAIAEVEKASDGIAE
ncbi:MAG TPA: preprotein translocase subunit YajC [Candidatus Blautia pullistercoris]|uniref:Preprotein translocase subunit YajC n=1 Tax=Candidatus Blautia pullistercoris TaxID=2838499 RepID=A0A9D1VK48_9FIRM|nr:preprotein translocase subunit YajC [Candidatus Blautia pullistercoris]